MQEYRAIITTPMDLGSIREQLASDVYETPVEFCKDVRLVFNNSRAYNTNKRSKVSYFYNTFVPSTPCKGLTWFKPMNKCIPCCRICEDEMETHKVVI